MIGTARGRDRAKSTAPRYIPRYTFNDYQQWEGDWELWNGIPVAMTPSPFFSHQACGAKLIRSLVAAVESADCEAAVAYEVDWIISNDTVVCPDILLQCGKAPDGHVRHPPALIVELLFPSTATRDRNEKLELYQENGVRYYLIVDPNELTIESYHLNLHGDFESFDPAGKYEFAVCDDCRIRWDVMSSLR